MITRWLHLEELGGDQWVLPVWAAANRAEREGRIGRLDADTYAIGLSISLKLNILARVIRRLNEGATNLFQAARAHESFHVFVPGVQGRALRIDNNLKYQVLGDIDAFLFEVNSCAELMERLVHRIYRQMGMQLDCEAIKGVIVDAHRARQLDLSWFRLLDKNRNFVAHQGACYLAIDISDPQRWELLIMRENVVEFEDQSAFFKLSDLSKISCGFSRAKLVLQEILVSAFDQRR